MLRQAVADTRRGDDDAATWLRGGGSVWAMWVWGTDPHTWRAYLRRGGFMREISVGERGTYRPLDAAENRRCYDAQSLSTDCAGRFRVRRRARECHRNGKCLAGHRQACNQPTGKAVARAVDVVGISMGHQHGRAVLGRLWRSGGIVAVGRIGGTKTTGSVEPSEAGYRPSATMFPTLTSYHDFSAGNTGLIKYGLKGRWNGRTRSRCPSPTESRWVAKVVTGGIDKVW